MLINLEHVLIIRKVVNDAMRLREESFVSSHDDEIPGGYLLDMEEAVIEACKLHGVHHLMAPLVWLAIGGHGNDVLGWADGDYDSSFAEDGTPIVLESNEKRAFSVDELAEKCLE